MLSTANEKGFPSLYTTLQMPSFVKRILKGSSRKRESNISPGASQCINTLNSSPQKLRQKHLDVGLDRSQTLLQTQGIAFCRAMATGSGGCSSSAAGVLTKEHSLPVPRP